ncbi:hypothetical protein [Saccharothrix sp.]|uniref:hypothetical protein n=1 Tax=Saccharothrix sp. TaxID=1873460 RepID=UPI0028120593|nr:hypothetical protein [Saccharothrix sp.]
MSDHKDAQEGAMHLMTSYNATGNEVTSVCQCSYGRPHLGKATRGHPVIGTPVSAGDLVAAVPGHRTWSVVDGCECGYACPSIEYWQAHVRTL